MKNNNIAILFLLVLIAFAGCNKDKELASRQPKVTNEEVTTTSNSATISWMVDFPGSIHTGIEIGLTEDLVDARIIEASNHNAVYSVSIDSLMPMTNYYYRQVVWNSYKRYEFDTQNFATKAGLPIVETLEVTDITRTTAVCGGKIISNCGAEIIECGICWATAPNPTIAADHIVAENSHETFTTEITDLVPEIQYYVRAYAKNSKGIAYGEEVSFTTGDVITPIVTTHEASGITGSTAVCCGEVTDDGGSTITIRGVCWSTTPNPTTSGDHINSDVNNDVFTINLSRLSANTTYYVRAYAKNSAGIGYGNEVCFNTTNPELPIIITTPVTNITPASAKCGGEVISDGGVNVSERGICWGINHNPTIVDFHTNSGSGIGSFTIRMTDLIENTVYYVRAYATNSVGTKYGEEYTFIPQVPQGATKGLFSVNGSKKVLFSQGNLQYVGSSNTWRFAENQWEYLGNNGQGGSSHVIIRDLFGWGTSGWNNGNTYYRPYDTNDSDGSLYGPVGGYSLIGNYSNSDWGVFNSISNGGNNPNQWRTLSKNEWEYVFNSRRASTINGIENARYVRAFVNQIFGVIIFPDEYEHPSDVSFPNFINYSGHLTMSELANNSYNLNDWTKLELEGCVFLPAAGGRYNGSIALAGEYGFYWSVSSSGNYGAYYVYYCNDLFSASYSYYPRYSGFSVRLVQDYQP